MCNPHTYREISKPRFEGWKKNAIAKGILLIGDESGDLVWGPVKGTFTWNGGKQELTLHIQFQTTEESCVSMYLDLGHMIPAKIAEGVVTPPGPALVIDEKGRYTVIGRVLRSGTVLEGVRVLAWDADKIGPDDKLGQGFTDDNGFFTISFDPSAFSDWGLDRYPDLYFKIFEGSQMIGETSGAVIKNAKPGIKDIVINLNR